MNLKDHYYVTAMCIAFQSISDCRMTARPSLHENKRPITFQINVVECVIWDWTLLWAGARAVSEIDWCFFLQNFKGWDNSITWASFIMFEHVILTCCSFVTLLKLQSRKKKGWHLLKLIFQTELSHTIMRQNKSPLKRQVNRKLWGFKCATAAAYCWSK